MLTCVGARIRNETGTLLKESAPGWDPARDEAELGLVERAEVPLALCELLVQHAARLYVLGRPPASDPCPRDGTEAADAAGEEGEVLSGRGGRDRLDVAERLDERLRVLRDGGNDNVPVGLYAACVVVTVDLCGKKSQRWVGRRGEESGAPAMRRPGPSATAVSGRGHPRGAATIRYTTQSRA